jgi:hypothetical protein
MCTRHEKVTVSDMEPAEGWNIIELDNKWEE